MITNANCKANSFEDISFTSPSISPSTGRRRSKRKQNPAVALDTIEDPIVSKLLYISYKDNLYDSDVDSDDNSKFDVDDEYVEDEVNKNIEDWCTLTAEERRSWAQAAAMENDTRILSINHSLYLSKINRYRTNEYQIILCFDYFPRQKEFAYNSPKIS